MEEVLNELRNENYSSKDVYKAADKLLRSTKYNTIPVDIVKLLQELDFTVGTQILDDDFCGYIAIDKSTSERFNSKGIIAVNKNDNIGHKRFTIAHELAHYIFDYNPKNESYYNTYKTNDVQTEEEIRANKFAANLLMPSNEFIDEYNSVRECDTNIVASLAEKFKVSAKAITKRMEELNLAY